MQFCKVADITDWNNPEFKAIAELLKIEQFKNRKMWEFTQVYYGLQTLGLLNDQTRAIGLGVGNERLIYAFTNVCGEVIATDLYKSPNWATAAMAVEEVYEKNPFPYRRDRLTVQHMDMTRVDYPDCSFDVVWSCCAIEHVNSFEALHQVYREIHRILKPGGIAALTTEFNASDHHSYEPNMLFTDRYWVEQWLTGENPLVQGFELIDTPDFTLKPDPGNTPTPRRQRPRTSIPLYSRDIVINSTAFFLRKTGEFTRAYDPQWLPTPLRIYFEGCEKSRLQAWEPAESHFKLLFADETLAPRIRVAAARRLMKVLQSQPDRQSDLITLCQQTIPLSPSAADTDHLLPIADCCKALGLTEAAKELYDRVVQSPGARGHQVTRSLVSMAQLFEQVGNPQQALTLVEKAETYLDFRGNEDYARVYYHQGLYREQLGQLEGAIAAYEKAISYAPPRSPFHQNSQASLQRCQRRRSSLLKDKVSSGLTQLKNLARQIWRQS